MAEKIPAIRFKQWLDEWDSYDFSAANHRRKPQPYIYLFSMPAVQLRSLSGVYRRRRDGAGAEGLQRFHDPKRSKIIRDFVRFGYPYGGIQENLRSESSDVLKKPGWLPTAIVVNILTADDVRRERRVDSSDLVSLDYEGGGLARIRLPYANRDEKWTPKSLEPLEVIDGQHRLWAFDEAIDNGSLPGDFELPVVAFHGLDIGWQAYLFWSINVSPKRINPSHAFDLYPLLRSQDWLETFSELKIYREARAQELTELLFIHSKSPWFQRINMLGASGDEVPLTAGVTQAGWVRALTSTFLSPGGRGRAAKGFFGADIGDDGPLDWSRPQQAALLISLWSEIKRAVNKADQQWPKDLKSGAAASKRGADGKRADPFTGSWTMLNQEQGLRGILSVSNDVLFSLATKNEKFFEWSLDIDPGTSTTVDDVTFALNEIKSQSFWPTVRRLARELASFDWRSSDAPGLSDDERLIRRAFRGSGGYVALREQLMLSLAGGNTRTAKIAKRLSDQARKS